MAAPVVRSYTVNYNDGKLFKEPDETVSVDFDVIDPDAYELTIGALFSDTQGNEVPFSGTLTQGDPVTMGQLTVGPAGHQIVRDPSLPFRLWVT